MTAETRVVTTEHEPRPITERTSSNTSQVSSHQGQLYTFKKYPVSQYYTSWQCTNPRTDNLVVSTRNNSTLGCPVGEFDNFRGRNLSYPLCIRKPTSSSVDLWRFQTGLKNSNNQWTAPVGCIPYWILHYSKQASWRLLRSFIYSFLKNVAFLNSINSTRIRKKNLKIRITLIACKARCPTEFSTFQFLITHSVSRLKFCLTIFLGAFQL